LGARLADFRAGRLAGLARGFGLPAVFAFAFDFFAGFAFGFVFAFVPVDFLAALRAMAVSS